MTKYSGFSGIESKFGRLPGREEPPPVAALGQICTVLATAAAVTSVSFQNGFRQFTAIVDASIAADPARTLTHINKVLLRLRPEEFGEEAILKAGLDAVRALPPAQMQTSGYLVLTRTASQTAEARTIWNEKMRAWHRAKPGDAMATLNRLARPPRYRKAQNSTFQRWAADMIKEITEARRQEMPPPAERPFQAVGRRRRSAAKPHRM
jgi:hypothetical protein